MAGKPKVIEYTTELRHVEPKPIWLTFEGTHMMIEGPLAFFYNMFSVMDSEEAARREFYPYLMSARRRWIERRARIEKAASAPQQETAFSTL